MNRRSLLSRLAAASLPLAAGCVGSDGDGGSDGGTSPTATQTTSPTQGTMATESPTTSPTATAGPSAQEKYPDYEWGKLEDATAVPATDIAMRNLEFHPLIAAVEPGTELTVTNEDSDGHTITAPALGLDETISAGASTTITADRTGTFDYVCTFHPPGMLGRLVVTENPPTETSTPSSTETPTHTETPTPSTELVTAQNRSFTPTRLDVAVGTEVTWDNRDSGTYASDHTVTSAQFHDVAADWDKDTRIEPNESTSYTFDSEGIYEYYCTVHGQNAMCGVVLAGDVSLDEDLPCE